MSQKTVLITGASRGIGFELSKIFAKKGYRLVLVSSNQDALKEAANALQVSNVVTITKDLADPQAPQAIYAICKKQGISVDVLVNNAGFGTYGLFFMTDLKDEQKMMQVNMVALSTLTKLFVGDMLKRGHGRVLNVASTAAFQPGPLMAVYYASKAYVLSFSEALAYELRGSGVKVSVLCPGPTKTGFQGRARMGDSKLDGRRTMSAAQVARIGYKGLVRGKRVIVPGFQNKMLTYVIKFMPRKMITGLVMKMQEQRV